MDKKKIDGKAFKEFAEDVGNAAVGLGIMAGEKAKPFAEKIGKGIKKLKPDQKTAEIETVIAEERVKESSKKEDKFEVDKILNSVIEGAYCGCKITDKKGIPYVGDKEVSRMNCESYELEVTSELVDKTKEGFIEYKKNSINPLIKIMSDKYIVILWRNGEKSVACVDSSKYDQIIKLLS